MKTKLLDDEFINRLKQMELISRKIISGRMKGERRSKRRGHSSEFADYRPYVSGDDIRFLDWNIFGRLDRLFLKLFLEEEDLWVNFLIDRSASMRFGSPDKLDYAKKIAAALGYIGLQNHDRVRVGAFSDRLVPVFGPARGRSRINLLFDSLDRLEPDAGASTSLVRGCRDFALERRLSGIVVLISDFFDRSGFESALRYLLSGGSQCEIFVLHILSPQEIEPPLTGDLKLVDLEDGVEADVSISAPLLKSYKKNLESFRAGIKEFATRRGMNYAFSSTAVPFQNLILDYLRTRGLVR